ncbi:hypothetical protein ACFSTH_08250 [Paenibacillus yanchengensis]|uniref:DUF5325 family protein n=1 Tax=Paenibacillus yanchengensis TaxID=2035833 RepID=A0ABW4YL04_9BACL
MKIIGFMILGMAIAYLSLLLGEFGLVLLGGAAFGLLLYIAINVSNNNK